MRVAHHLQIQSSYLAFTTPLFYHHQSINTMFRFQFLLALCLLVQATSFAPTATTARSGKIYRPASLLSGARPTTVHGTARRMSSNDEDTATGVESKISADGTFYDDEVRLCLCSWDPALFASLLRHELTVDELFCP